MALDKVFQIKVNNMNIHIEFIPSKDQRYETGGDWFFDDSGDLIIKISNDDQDFPTEDHQHLVALHELVEALLCRKHGITQQMVDDFDMSEAQTLHAKNDEPGDHIDAPYRREHRFAMLIEHLMARELGLDGYGVVL